MRKSELFFDDDDDVWGTKPTLEEVTTAIKTNDDLLRELSKRAIDLSYESQLFAHELGLPIEEVWKLGEQRKVITFSVGTTRYYPKWQVDEGKLIEGLGLVINAFPGDGLSITNWGVKSSDRLSGKTPAECLRNGDLYLVLNEIAFIDPHNR